MRKVNTTLAIAMAAGLLAGAAIGVAGQSDEAAVAAPVEFTGTSAPGGCPVAATTEAVGDVQQTRGGYCHPTYSFSDPRLEGTVTWAASGDRYLDGSGLVIESVAIRIENEDGAWRQRPILSFGFPGVAQDRSRQLILVGEGAYDGLFAVADGFMVGPLHGFIIEGGLPPPPETASAE